MSQARDLGDAANKANFLDNVTSDIQPQLTPAGTIITFGGTSAPTGYLACEGQEVLISDYSALYTAIGTAWGTASSPASHFKLPDLRGAFLRGTGSNGTHNMANGNDFAGQAVGSFENDQFQGHKHSLTNIYRWDAPYWVGGSGSRYADSDATETGTPITDGSHGTPRTGDETRPFNAGILYCIKT
jgi:hypothetical protein